MTSTINEQLIELLRGAGVTGAIELVTPPNPELGDFAFACFFLARAAGRPPVEVAVELAEKLARASVPVPIVEKIVAFGPYVNFFLHGAKLAELVLPEILEVGDGYGRGEGGAGKRVMVEFAHPNTHKAFHIGHLRTLLTGESIARLLENSGWQVVRANYQGDVGLHIAKCLYGILHTDNWPVKMAGLATVGDKAQFLGAAYAAGAKAYEASESVKIEVAELNKKLYEKDPALLALYQQTRQWSLDYFDAIYVRLGTRFDRLYFESEVYERGIEIVRQYLARGVFVASSGAVIFEGSKHGLHDRVFLTGLGHPTYEAKELALGELQFKEFDPERIYHVVAKEQSEYFKVAFKALELTLPESAGREHHLVYGWVRIKGGKMSSRTGTVVLAEQLLGEVKQAVLTTMSESVPASPAVRGTSSSAPAEPEAVAERVALAAIKYSYLKTGIQNDIVFDIGAAVNLSGDSGPYILYMGARLSSILKKETASAAGAPAVVTSAISAPEKQLLLQLAEFPTVTKQAAEALDPSLVARYLLGLAQKFTAFYEACPVLKAEEPLKHFRLNLCRATLTVGRRGLHLLGIETVEAM